MEDVPVQYFQSVIAIQLAVTGALLWNIRYFDRHPGTDPARSTPPNPWLLLLVASILGATLFGSLYSIRHGGQERAASAVTAGLALSMTPVLLRVLPPIRRRPDSQREPHAPVAVLGLALYAAVTTLVVIALNG